MLRALLTKRLGAVERHQRIPGRRPFVGDVASEDDEPAILAERDAPDATAMLHDGSTRPDRSRQ